MNIRFVKIIFLLFLSFSVQAEIYRWTDANGKKHFSDKAPDHTKSSTVDVKINTYTQVTYESVAAGGDVATGVSDKVIMYSTTWCSYCKKARQYFIKNNIPFAEYDIETDRQARGRYDAMGAKGVPVIVVGDRRMNGFSAAGFNQLLQQ